MRPNGAWLALRQKVIARAGGVCERCKQRRGVHVHHLIYGGRKRGTEPLEWLQLVCLPCHGDYHPRHTFRPVHEQRKIAEKRRARRQWRAGQPQAGCQWCGGTYSAAKHRRVCVKHGVSS
jgi:hypothetical protein